MANLRTVRTGRESWMREELENGFVVRATLELSCGEGSPSHTIRILASTKHGPCPSACRATPAPGLRRRPHLATTRIPPSAPRRFRVVLHSHPTPHPTSLPTRRPPRVLALAPALPRPRPAWLRAALITLSGRRTVFSMGLCKPCSASPLTEMRSSAVDRNGKRCLRQLPPPRPHRPPRPPPLSPRPRHRHAYLASRSATWRAARWQSCTTRCSA